MSLLKIKAQPSRLQITKQWVTKNQEYHFKFVIRPNIFSVAYT